MATTGSLVRQPFVAKAGPCQAARSRATALACRAQRQEQHPLATLASKAAAVREENPRACLERLGSRSRPSPGP